MAKILVVDDEEPIRDAVHGCLELQDHDIHSAASVEAANALMASSGPFDLVITDLLMPGENGYDILRATKALGPGIPVIVMSGGGSRFDRKTMSSHLRDLGADGVLLKPFTPVEINSLVQAVLESAAR